jgi:FixJ family two-component response regulator
MSDPVVHIVDDDEAVRDSLRILAQSAGYAVRSYAGGEEFLQAGIPDRPGCLVLDVRLQDHSGLDLQDQLAAAGIGLPVIIVTGHGDIPLTVQAMRRGALDVLEKPYDERILLQRIRQAVAISEKNREERGRRMEIASRLASLTPRERQVLDLVVSGWPNKRIAADLGITMKTVEAHRAHMMEKMRADSLAELVRLVESVRAPDGQPATYATESERTKSL